MVAGDGESADRGKVLGQATQLLGGLSVMDLTAILPVLETYSMNGGAGMYSFSAEDLDILDQMILESRATGMERCSATDLAVFINNSGTAHDRAEAFVTVFPIARRVFERDDEEIQADHSKA